MVVSKDSKRKRKESSPPPAVESSPEMPKRTKVQAQRKFAQGQSAPASSYNSIIAASSSSNTGPSTSSESREPPTEILPNKRPRTEDFLTFLCFRGTSALPARLDFLNQGKSKETEGPVKKSINKSTKTTKKGKKGRPKAATVTATVASVATSDEPKASTSTAAIEADKKEMANTSATTIVAKTEEIVAASTTVETENQEKSTEDNIIPFAVRKRAEVVTDGNRRNRTTERQLRNNPAEAEKCNNSPETKRRSNRTSAKEVKPMIDPDTDEDEEYYSAKDEAAIASKAEDQIKESQDISKTPVPHERNLETPSKESETDKSRKGKASTSATKKGKDAIKENNTEDHKSKENASVLPKSEHPVKEKPQPIKRPRQKESPIFIPSPEPSGRMTRQRAFFEPVKVPHRDDHNNVDMNETEKSMESIDRKKDLKEEEIAATLKQTNESKVTASETKTSKLVKVNTDESVDKISKNLEHDKGKPNLNVFDFSSDDEQPLAKAIKLKKGKGTPKKAAARANKPGRKLSPKKLAEKITESTDTKSTTLDDKEVVKQTATLTDVAKVLNTEDDLKDETTNNINANKNKRGKNAKKKLDEQTEEEKELLPPSPKKSTNARQARKKPTKADNHADNSEGEDEHHEAPPNVPIRNQRPTRKTKEAAAIYMGIIGHKLQLADDEDDDLSLNSFPDLPNVKEMEKMEIELKKNAAQAAAVSTKTAGSPTINKSSTAKQSTKTESPISSAEKPTATTGRRGRPPKQAKQVPVKREIEGMLVKKGAIAKLALNANDSVGIHNKGKSVASGKVASDDEDFLLNEEVNETKRKLEKSFSDSDDEPLAIKANVKSSEKDTEQDSRKSDYPPQTPPTATSTLAMLPLTTKPVSTPPLTTAPATNASPITAAPQSTTSQAPPSPFKSIEKKSPIPTSKILNVPATYAIPTAANSAATPMVNFNKTTSYLPQASPHYHASHIRPTATHAFPTAKSPTAPAPAVSTSHLTAPLPPQSPLKYQTPPTTYPPPIEAYPSPKINPNFLTPKFDRTSLPRSNNFPSPSPVKFDVSSGTSKAGQHTGNSTLSPKNPLVGGIALTTPANNIASTSAAASNSNDPLKDEIGAILAANLMPSKEESGKIFGIASVSLAQSSGPDNTKCTLGKCGSIHKPVLGPVVPTEGYIGDQLSSKERRKAKVNMTHEQIQKWLIECSSNPDEIQDDLEDDFDDNLRPNLFATTPPPTRDDKESTSFSSSSKATRDLGKSESAWSAKGPSLKATPVVATTNRKDDTKQIETTNTNNATQLEVTTEKDKPSAQAINLTHKSSAIKHNSNASDSKTTAKEKTDKKTDKKSKEDKAISKETTTVGKDNKQSKIEKEKEVTAITSTKSTVAGKQSNTAVAAASAQNQQSTQESPTTSKQTSRKKIVSTTPTMTALVDKSPNTHHTAPKSTANADSSHDSTPATARTPKRTPVYNQKAAKQLELQESTTTSHKKTAPFSYSAFSADNEKSIYSFDKDDDVGGVGSAKPSSKPAAYRRQSRRDSQPEEVVQTTPTSRTSPTKKRAAAAAAEKANKDIANASQSSSVSLTLSPSENCKLVKVSLDAEKAVTAKSTTSKATKGAKKPEVAKVNEAAADSDSDGHTFYIPLQGSGTGPDGEGGIQGVAVKLGREGPDGPNQKVIMHATLVTKAQMGSNSKPLPDSMNVSEIVKTLITSSNATQANAVAEMAKKGTNAPSTSAAAAAAAAASNSASNSLKNVPIGTVQPRFKGGLADPTLSQQPSTSHAAASGTGGRLVRVNSNSSLFSGSAKSRVGGAPAATAHNANKKFKDDTPIKMSNNTAFPRHDDPTQMVEAPIFRPTEKEFADPIEFIERITPIAARFGICKIIPPATFKPECRISDEMRFTAYNQYVHKMLHRWGPSAKELSAIKKYLATQSIVMNHPPWIGGMEVDLPRLYHTVQELGGLKEVIEKKKWARVAEEMCIPKLAQDRVTKLDDIYCKYLLPYDTLSPAERQKLFDEVEADWAKREARARRNADRFVNTESVSNEEDDVTSEDDEESEEEVDGVSMECIVKGRSMPLSQFYRIARNTMALWFKNTEPIVNEVEAEFWRHVAVRDSHVCVHSGSIDSSGWGYGFPSPGPKGKGSNYARHPWNLKVLTNNPGSVLRSLGPVMGVTVPTLHVGMLFSACCWYRDPHGLSWIEYLHTGASKLWYGIPDDQSANFRAALTSLIPTHCQNKTIWLPCDTVMVPPHMLTDRGVSLCRIEQKPGEFIVVFPRAYTSSLATGYVVSESVYFATTSWLDLAKDDFRDIHDSCEPAMFSLEQLLFALGYDQRVTPDTLHQMQPMLHEVFEKETAAREQLKAAGVTSTEKVLNEKCPKAKKQQQPPFKSIESECDLCRANLYISMVRTEEGSVYCLQHALKNLNNGNIQAKQCKLIYAYNVEDIENLIKNLKDKIQQKRNAVVNKKK